MGTFTDHFDSLETRAPAERSQAQFEALRRQLTLAKEKSTYFATSLKAVDPRAVTDAKALAALPILRKSDLMDRQGEAAPFGGLITVPPGGLGRIFQSPGPIYDPEGWGVDYWRTARALFAAGFRKGDIVHNTFSYHLTPGGFIMDCGARALGCAVIPAGVGQTEQQLRAIADLRPNGYSGTPSFLKILLDKGREGGVDMRCFKKAVVSGEALPPSLRAQFQELGITVRQIYATADVGLIAYESPALEGMVIDEGVIVEIVRPGTGDPVAEGEVGEVVVTLLTTPEYPLIRFATGDLSAILPGASPCGRTNVRIKGWMGRADQTTKIKGMFVHPSQVAEVIRRHPDISKARLVVSRANDNDVMTLHCEVPGGGNPALADAIELTLRAVCKIGGKAVFAAVGSLINDGKVIDDTRKFE